jgi:hypothetical protein
MEGHLEWTLPAPLWPLSGDPLTEADRLRFRTPAILRFASDSFMQEFLDLLNTEPQRLNEFVAVPETWSSPPHEPAAPAQRGGMALTLFRARNAAVRRLQARGQRVIGQSRRLSPAKVLKLYQPAHQRFYLVSTCLVCRMLGLPDRRIDPGAAERATFVLRMLQPRTAADPQNPDPCDCDELALVNGAWQPVGDPVSFVDGEEQHPLSPAAYTEDDQRRRRLLIGMIPVGDRERLLQMPRPGPSGAMSDALQMLLKTQVITPMSSLENLATASAGNVNKPTPFPNPLTQQDRSQIADLARKIVDLANDQIQQMSWYILLDLARYFETNLPDLWRVIQADGDGSGLPATQRTVLNTLSQTTYLGTKMLDAVQQAFKAADALERASTKYDSHGDTTGWPPFTFQFYRVTLTGAVAAVQNLQPPLSRDTFEAQIVQALKTNPSLNPPLPVRAVAQANVTSQVPVWFTIRCVLDRPNCGALIPALVSEPTVAFQLAAFFDPDAPSRPIRIGLPIDTTPAGLRKFDKNTAFVMSDTLCGQVNKMGSMSFADLVLSVLPFPFHQGLSGGDGLPCKTDGLPSGMVCSFSIPIITICALILLIIFVKLLDIVFFWMPFFQICLPLPKFSAKA